MTSEARERWAEQLPGPTGTTAEAAAALLRALPGDRFSPPAERVAAVNALAGTSVPVGRDPDAERLLRAELDSFASGYWGLAPAERLVAWADLSRREADPVRLRELEPGLDVAAPALGDPTAEALAGLIRVLFVMPPRARAVRRNTWLREQAAHAEKWRAALVAVQRAAPALVALEPRLRAALAPNFPLATFVQGASAEPITVPATDATETDARGLRPSKRAASAGSVSSSWLGSAAVVGLFMIVKLLVGLGGSAKTSNYAPAPQSAQYSTSAERLSRAQNAADLEKVRKAYAEYKARRTETGTPFAGRPSPSEFTPDEVAVYDRYDREKDAGESPASLPVTTVGTPPGARAAPRARRYWR